MYMLSLPRIRLNKVWFSLTKYNACGENVLLLQSRKFNLPEASGNWFVFLCKINVSTVLSTSFAWNFPKVKQCAL